MARAEPLIAPSSRAIGSHVATSPQQPAVRYRAIVDLHHELLKQHTFVLAPYLQPPRARFSEILAGNSCDAAAKRRW